jgi:hypothetical protein
MHSMQLETSNRKLTGPSARRSKPSDVLNPKTVDPVSFLLDVSSCIECIVNFSSKEARARPCLLLFTIVVGCHASEFSENILWLC